MPDFFISYNKADRAKAEWIAFILEEAKYSTRIQAWDFGPGKNFVLAMHEAAAECKRTIAVLSPDYLQSRFTAPEWAAAFSHDPDGKLGLVLPVRVREVDPTGVLAPIVYIDLVGLDETAAQAALLEGVLRERRKPKTRPKYEKAGPIAQQEATVVQAGDGILPVDRAVARGSLPAGSRMPFAANPLFVGREDDLRALARNLNFGGTSAIGEVKLTAASGMGGMGKTQLAVEFVYRYGRYFEGGVFWLSFSKPEAVASEVADCGQVLGLYLAWSSLSLADQSRLVQEAWHLPSPRLLVFDNCEEEILLSEWRPHFGGARVLITSRRDRWGQTLGVETLPLSTLPREKSVELLRGFRPDLRGSDPALADIADALGDLPLALHLAGNYLGEFIYAPFGQPGAYLEALRKGSLLDHPSLQGSSAKPSPTGHELHVGRTFALSLDRLDSVKETDALALDLLARAAFFAPSEPILRKLLLLTIDLREEGEDRERSERALLRLTSLGLLESNAQGAVAIHRLVALFAQGLAASQVAKEAVKRALLAEAERLNATGALELLAAWVAHLRFVTERSWEVEDQVSRGLCETLGLHLEMTGDNSGARRYYERALAIDERVLGPEHPNTAGSLNSLGFLLQAEGDLAGARPYYERALAIWEKVLGPEHPDTATSLNNLGSLLQAEGDLAGSRPLYERALAISEKVLGPEHSDTATSLNNLGDLLQAEGDLAGARPYYERALAIWEKVLGPEHPQMATKLNSLGFLLQAEGDLAGARPYYERALAIWEKVLGPEHPDTATSLNNLGALLQAEGNLAVARPYYERALAICEKVLGPEHPDTASSLNSLGFLLQAEGDLAGARPYYERALAIWEKVLGPEHPDTAISLNNLGFLLQAEGEVAGARPYYERALAIWEKVLGPEHPDTATSLNNLGSLLQDDGDLAGARPYFETALAIREKVLGPEHPSTATSLDNLGSLLQAEGALADARPYYERSLGIREKVLGPEHPDTAISLNNLGLLLQAESDLGGARPYLERGLAIWEKVLGPEHPNTASSLNNLGSLLQAEGDLARARLYMERSLAIWEKVLGSEHPETAQSLNNLGALLQAEGDLGGARPYIVRSLAIREKVLGPEHPDTAQSLNNLGFLLHAEGKLAGARPYYKRALAIWEKVLGPEHPKTRLAQRNLDSLA